MISTKTARHLALPLVTAFAFTSCSTLQPVHSKPPFSKIILSKPYDGEGFMFHLHMPPGEYPAAYEEGTTYYYQAPSKISIRTIATEYRDGGFYLDAKSKVMRGWWYFDDDGNKTNGVVGAPLPDYKTIP